LLTAARLRSGDLFSEHAFRWLGLRPGGPGPGLGAPPPPPPAVPPRRLRALPWAVAAAACVAAVWFCLDCHEHRLGLEGQLHQARPAQPGKPAPGGPDHFWPGHPADRGPPQANESPNRPAVVPPSLGRPNHGSPPGKKGPPTGLAPGDWFGPAPEPGGGTGDP